MRRFLNMKLVEKMSDGSRRELWSVGYDTRTGSEVVAAGEVKSEKALHEQVKGWLDRKGVSYVHGRMDKKSTVGVGVSDFVICWKGRFVAVELKTKTGKVRETQLLWGERVKENGGEFAVIRSYEDFRVFMESM